MTPQQYLDVLRSRWRVVVACLVLGVVLGAAFSFLVPSQYSSKVVIFVSARSATGDLAAAVEGNDLSTQRITTYVELMRSDKIAGEVAAAFPGELSSQDVADKITATTVPETVLLTATVVDGSAERAAEIANLVAARFIDNVAQLERPVNNGPQPPPPVNPAGEPVVTARVFEAATPATGPVSPNPPFDIAVGAAIGLLAGLGVALLRHSLDKSVKTREQLEELAGAPVLGEIGFDAKIAKSPMVVWNDPHAQPAEAFRQLRTNIRFFDVDRNHQVVLVTSPAEGEGKSTTVCNLGATLAEAGVRVVIVDADLRRPTVAKCIGVDGTVGLTNVLVNRVPVNQAIQAAGPSLDVLPSGPTPPNPSEILGSDQMATLVEELRVFYDVILLDTSPLLPVTDAAVLAPRADGVLLVVRRNRTTVPQITAARDALEAVSARLLGTVLTMVPVANRDRYTAYRGATSGGRSTVGGPPARPPREPATVTGRARDTPDSVSRPTPRPRAGVGSDAALGLPGEREGDQAAR